MPVNFKAVLFDLDGTLLDTLDDLADSMNSALSKMKLPVHPVSSYRYFVGDGVKTLVRRVLSPDRQDEESVNTCLDLMQEEYGRRWADKTKPYPGIMNMLERLHAGNVPLAVLSNKNDEFTTMVVSRYFPSGVFSMVCGHKKETPLKPDPSGALEIADRLNVKPSDFAYLGDTSTDMVTASGAGMCAIGALWGFRTEEELLKNGARHVIESPDELCRML
jgi:phosphoglycolate phosphatase